MRRIQLVSSGTILRLRQQAEQAWNDRDLEKCLDILNRASRLDPANIAVLLQLGRVQGICYDYESAQQSFDKAARLTTQRFEILTAIGKQARDFYDTSIAERYLSEAARDPAAPAESLVTLAELYEKMHRVDDARELIDRALESQHSFAPAILVKARIEHQSGHLESAETLLRSEHFKSAQLDCNIKRFYELGAVLDRQRRFDEAMNAFEAAKCMLRSTAAPYIEHLRKVRVHLSQLREGISEQHIVRWAQRISAIQQPTRLTLLGGHPRSGTTLLEQVLDSHPCIVSVEESTHFTDYAYSPLQRLYPHRTPMLQILDSASDEALTRGRSEYLRASESCIGEVIGDRILIDKNPSLTFSIASLIRFFPEMKFLIAIRDPRDVVLSCFMQPFVPIQQVSSGYLSLSSTSDEYVSLMSMWKTMLPIIKNPTLELRYEDMVEDLETCARRALSFVGVPWDDRVLDFHQHARQKVVRSPTYADVTQKVFKRARGRWQNYAKHIEPHLEKLMPFVKMFGYE